MADGDGGVTRRPQIHLRANRPGEVGSCSIHAIPGSLSSYAALQLDFSLYIRHEYLEFHRFVLKASCLSFSFLLSLWTSPASRDISNHHSRPSHPLYQDPAHAVLNILICSGRPSLTQTIL